ncbi:peroxisomal membrane anchor protein conserved region-domain-containing protein [Aspergillus aurantiobrunneus]
MSDSESKFSIPQWQQQHAASSPASSDGKDAGDDADRSTLLEQASKFLQDDSIRDAPTDRKIAFLESKGLASTEIDNLLGVSRNPEASGSSNNSAEDDKTTSTTSTEASNQASSVSTSSPASANTKQASPSAPRDVPPIITYPEFLLHQSKPPPLVTLRSVLYTIYGAAGLGATIYSASEYIVKPMLATLTNARHDLAQTTEENLSKLNEKLEQNVSQIPPSLLSAKPTATSTSDTPEEDTESITSDPTELFHRDIGTQTSQDLTQPSTTTTTSPTDPALNDPTATITTHQKRLESIGSHLRDLEDAQSQSTTLHDTTRSRISDLQRYLDGLLYSKNSYPYSATTGYGVYSTPGIDSGGAAATGVGKAEEEAISNFRADIRGVKGALLSARNFPSGRGAGLRSSFVR